MAKYKFSVNVDITSFKGGKNLSLTACKVHPLQA